MAICLTISRWVRLSGCYAGYNAPPAARCSDNQRDDNADTRQKNQPDSVISNGVWYYWEDIGAASQSYQLCRLHQAPPCTRCSPVADLLRYWPPSPLIL